VKWTRQLQRRGEGRRLEGNRRRGKWEGKRSRRDTGWVLDWVRLPLTSPTTRTLAVCNNFFERNLKCPITVFYLFNLRILKKIDKAI
jgi:hypothetical protein